MTSCLADAINSMLTAIGEIPYSWGSAATDRSRPTKLFQLVRMWNDQVSRELNGTGYTFEKPACFLEIGNRENEMFLQGVNTANYVWRFHIIDAELDAGDEVNMDQNLTVIHFRDAVKQALCGFQPPNCSTLFPVNEEADYQHTDLYHYILDLKSLFTDTKGSPLDPDQTTVTFYTPPPNLGLELDVTIG